MIVIFDDFFQFRNMKKGVITVLRRPANRPDAQLLESATVV